MDKNIPSSVNCLIELTLRKYASAAREYILTLTEEELALLGVGIKDLEKLTGMEMIKKIYMLRESTVTWAGSFSSRACELGVDVDNLMHPEIRKIVSAQINFIAKVMSHEPIRKIFSNLDRCREVLSIGTGLSAREISDNLYTMIEYEKVL